MAEFTDQRAIRRYGPGYLRARSVLSVVMVVADAEGRITPADLRDIAARARLLPGLGGVEVAGLVAAAMRALEDILRDGVECAFARAAVRLDRQDATAALVLACEIAAEGGREGEAMLRPMARRLGVRPERLASIRVLADRRRSAVAVAA